MSFDLRNFLRRAPKPVKLRIRTADDDERMIELSSTRRRWDQAEEAVRTAGAVSIECLSADGTILRSKRLSEEDGDAENDADAQAKYEDKLLTKDRRENAAMLDRYGARLSQAFDAGAKAASASQDKLVALVEILSENLSTAIINLHTISANSAAMMQQNAEQVAALRAALAEAGSGEGGSTKALELVAGLLMSKGAQSTQATPNGKGGHK